MNYSFLVVSIFFQIIAWSQSKNFKQNDCISNYQITFYDSANVGFVDERHTSPNDNEIHILIERESYILNSRSSPNVDELVSRLISDQEKRKYTTDYYFTIGIQSSTQISILNELLCGLLGIEEEISSDRRIKLYLY